MFALLIPVTFFIIAFTANVISNIVREVRDKLADREMRLLDLEAANDEVREKLQNIFNNKLPSGVPVETPDEKLARILLEHERVQKENAALTSENAMLKRTSPFR